MERANKRYQAGEFDLFGFIIPYTTGDDVNQSRVYGASETTWLKALNDNKLKALNDDGKDHHVTTAKYLTRNHTNTAVPNETILRVNGVDYDIIEVERIGRYLHTLITVQRHAN